MIQRGLLLQQIVHIISIDSIILIPFSTIIKFFQSTIVQILKLQIVRQVNWMRLALPEKALFLGRDKGRAHRTYLFHHLLQCMVMKTSWTPCNWNKSTRRLEIQRTISYKSVTNVIKHSKRQYAYNNTNILCTLEKSSATYVVKPSHPSHSYINIDIQNIDIKQPKIKFMNATYVIIYMIPNPSYRSTSIVYIQGKSFVISVKMELNFQTRRHQPTTKDINIHFIPI